MDPNETLAELMALLRAGPLDDYAGLLHEWDRVDVLVTSLDAWMRKGGSAPSAWRQFSVSG